jgi:hypothetical protein
LLPSRLGKTDEAWLKELDSLVPGKLSRSSTFGGRPAELTIEAAISQQENGWKFSTSDGSGVYPFASDWIPFGHSGISTNAPVVFQPGKPIVLLHLTKPKLELVTIGGVVRSELPSDPTEGIVLVLKP